MKIVIPTPHNFSFERTILSHGWCQLLPFECDRGNLTLTRVVDVVEGQPVVVVMSAAKAGVEVNVPRSRLGVRAAERVVSDVRHMLRLDDDMTEFATAMSAEPEFKWISRVGAGRMLRSPTVFEDLAKTICTTNCAWSSTIRMTSVLTNTLGRKATNDWRAFPTAEAMAGAPSRFYRDEMRAGYRAAYLRELAERVASEKLDVEAWLASELPTDELRREMKSVKGVGDYAAENLLKLVGRYDVLALDSWLRAQFIAKHNKGRGCSDKKIARYYSRFGSWRGLALWCDMTKDWIDDAGHSFSTMHSSQSGVRA